MPLSPKIHLQDDSQQVCRLASHVDIPTALEGLPQLPTGSPSGHKPEYALGGWSMLLQDSQQVLQGIQEDSCLAEDRPWGR